MPVICHLAAEGSWVQSSPFLPPLQFLCRSSMHPKYLAHLYRAAKFQTAISCESRLVGKAASKNAAAMPISATKYDVS